MERNARWAKRVNSADPTFFPRHFPGQRPEILWIGCECEASLCDEIVAASVARKGVVTHSVG